MFFTIFYTSKAPPDSATKEITPIFNHPVYWTNDKNRQQKKQLENNKENYQSMAYWRMATKTTSKNCLEGHDTVESWESYSNSSRNQEVHEKETKRVWTSAIRDDRKEQGTE